MKKCPKCENLHKKPGKFCSRKCANSRGPRSEETKRKISESVKKSPSGFVLDRSKSHKNKKLGKDVKCLTCDNVFYRPKCKEYKKYCSSKCNPNIGGYRNNSGRSKSGYYKKIYCGSTYELVWVIYNLDHNIKFKKFEGFIEYSGGKKYFPDFFQDDVIIEIKGYHTETVDKKTKAAKDKGYNIKLLYKKDLKYCFDWVKNNYSYKKLEELYDGYKPRYKYTCKFCNTKFNTDVKRKKELKYCSQSCAGKSLKYR